MHRRVDATRIAAKMRCSTAPGINNSFQGILQSVDVRSPTEQHDVMFSSRNGGKWGFQQGPLKKRTTASGGDAHKS